MSKWLVVAVGLVYLVVALDQLIKNNNGVATMFLGYVVANAGVYFTVV